MHRPENVGFLLSYFSTSLPPSSSFNAINMKGLGSLKTNFEKEGVAIYPWVAFGSMEESE